MNRLKKISFFILLTLILVLTDQLTKALAVHFLSNNTITIIPDFFKLELLWNRGAAFGILQDSRLFFCILTIIVCFVIEFYYFRIPDDKKYRLMKIDAIILFSGAIGNLIDRLKSGSVVDYLAFTFGTYHFPSFNVADIFVSISAVGMLILVLFYYNDEQLSAVFARRNKNGRK